MSQSTVPTHSTTFIGRQTDLNEISTLLAESSCRLLTVVGLGGAGKTRLALEVARWLQDSFTDGVYFIPLQPLQNPDQIIQATLIALNLEIDRDPHAHLLSYLSERQLLLVMDNFEHLMGGIDLLTDILTHSTKVKIIVTSRESLQLQGEWIRQVYGLDYPDNIASLSNGHYSAVQLFNERAQRLRSDLDIDTQHPYIVKICRLVEGLPLALELAAGWIKTLSCKEIAEEIQRNRDILAARAKDMPERHRSMQAVFDHSWFLLNEDDQAVLRRFAIFRGGCTREAAEQITGASLSILAGLVEKSLLRHDANSGRYDMQELLRQYVHEHLEAAGEEMRIRNLHSQYYAMWCHTHFNSVSNSEQAEFLKRVNAELDNIRISWAWALERENYDVIDRLIDTLMMYFHKYSRTVEIGDLFQTAATQLVNSTTDREQSILGRLLGRLADWTAMQSRNDDAELLFQQSMQIAREQNNLKELHRSQRFYAWFILGICRAEYSRALPLIEESVAFYRDQENKNNLAWSLLNLARVYGKMGQAEQQQKLLLEAYRIYKDDNDPSGMSVTLMYLGYKAANEGRWTESQRFLQELIELDQSYDSGDNKFNTIRAYFMLMMVAVMQGDFEQAQQHEQSVLRIQGPHNYHHIDFKVTLHCNISRSLMLDVDGTTLEALHLTEEAIADAKQRGDMPEVVQRGQIARAWHLCGLGEFDDATGEITDMLPPSDEFCRLTGHLTFVIAIAARILAHNGKHTLATKLLGLVYSHPNSPQGYLQCHPQMQQLQDKLKVQLGAETYEMAWASGTKLEPEHVARELLRELTTYNDDSLMNVRLAMVEPLTARELEVLALIIDGFTNREIARQLHISVNTVKKHINHIFGKLDVKNRPQAIAKTHQLNILPQLHQKYS